jgi:polysaccharide export outer membrane protein
MKTFLTFTMMSVLIAGPVAAQMAPAIPAVQPPATHSTAPMVQTPASPPVSYAGTSSVIYSYRLGAGDKIKVTVFGEPDLGGLFAVSGEGKISAPLIGDVQAAGLTTADLQASLETAYRQGYLKDPKVNVEVMNFRPFYILGEVKMPGEYPFDNGMTVVKAVALAQGFTYRADQKHVYIKHLNSLTEEQVNLTSVQPVEPGDTIRIAERYF